MRLRISLLALLVFLIGCSTYTNISQNDLIGIFYGLSRDQIQGSATQYNLVLKEDNIFKLSIKGHDFNSKCKGVWERKEDTIILKCSDTESIAEKLSNGYMNQREFVINIINKNNLRLKNLIIKRK